MRTYTIGEAAQAAGVTARAVRLYESKGLVRAFDRTGSGYRVLTDDHVEALRFVRRGRSLGLSLDAIAEVIEIAASGEPCCDRTKALLRERVAEIDAAISDLRSLRQTIVATQRTDVDQSAGARCAVIEAVG